MSYIYIHSEGLQALCQLARDNIEAHFEPKIKPYRDAYNAEMAKWKSRSKWGQFWHKKPELAPNDDGVRLIYERDEKLKRLNTIHISTLFGDGGVQLSCEDIEFVSNWAER